jgi:RNA polymerase sigma-70 factor (ECF subfamily)
VTAAADEVERVARLSWGRLVARIARRTGNPQAAADALADALVAALAHWPDRGIPDRPEAWLLATAVNAARSAGRRRSVAEASRTQLALLDEERAAMAEAATPTAFLT